MEGRYGADEPLAGVRAPRNEPIERFPRRRAVLRIVRRRRNRPTKRSKTCWPTSAATCPTLDEHDRRVIEETRDGTTTYKGSITGLPGLPDSQDDVGGWEDYPEVHRAADWDTDDDGMPNAWETAHGLNPNSPAGDFSDANADPDGDGYTNLEEYLNQLGGKP